MFFYCFIVAIMYVFNFEHDFSYFWSKIEQLSMQRESMIDLASLTSSSVTFNFINLIFYIICILKTNNESLTNDYRIKWLINKTSINKLLSIIDYNLFITIQRMLMQR